jgi:transposase-like protein
MHIGTLCEELGISPSTLKRWRLQMESRREADPVLVTATSGCGAASMRFSRHGETKTASRHNQKQQTASAQNKNCPNLGGGSPTLKTRLFGVFYT